MKIFDMHCDTLLEMYLKKKDLAELDGHINLEKLRSGGALLQCFAAFLPTHDCAAEYGLKETPYELFCAMADIFDAQMERYKDVMAPVRCYDDIARNASC